MKHLGHHMQELALFTLPDLHDGAEGEPEGIEQVHPSESSEPTFQSDPYARNPIPWERLAGFTSINKTKNEPNWYHLSNMIQHESNTSINRWSQATLNKVMAAAPPPNDQAVKTHIGGESPSDSLERKELAEWFRFTAIDLINQQLKLEGKEPVGPDSYAYLAVEGPPEANLQNDRPRLAGFTSINETKNEPNLYHLSNIIKNVSDNSISRWSQDTLDRVMAAVPQPNDQAVKTHIGGSRSDSLGRKELAQWFRLTMSDLINRQLKIEGKETVDPYSYDYLVSGDESLFFATEPHTL